MMRSPIKAIAAKCKDCVYDELDAGAGGVNAQIEACGDMTCSLYMYRPLTVATKQVKKEERIAKMSVVELASYQKKADATRERFHGSK